MLDNGEKSPGESGLWPTSTVRSAQATLVSGSVDQVRLTFLGSGSLREMVSQIGDDLAFLVVDGESIKTVQ